jgi:acyl transferase domain-containing protein
MAPPEIEPDRLETPDHASRENVSDPNACHQHMDHHNATPPAYTSIPIAICGMGMRLPGGIRDPESLYQFLLHKRDARSPPSPKRFNLDGWHDAHGRPGTLPMLEGYWLDDEDLFRFDAPMFSMNAAEVEKLDPQQRILLEIVREAFESAGESAWRGKSIGCFVGSFGEDWNESHARDTLTRGFYTIPGKMDFMHANRISYEYDLRGPR